MRKFVLHQFLLLIVIFSLIFTFSLNAFAVDFNYSYAYVSSSNEVKVSYGNETRKLSVTTGYSGDNIIVRAVNNSGLLLPNNTVIHTTLTSMNLGISYTFSSDYIGNLIITFPYYPVSYINFYSQPREFTFVNGLNAHPYDDIVIALYNDTESYTLSKSDYNIKPYSAYGIVLTLNTTVNLSQWKGIETDFVFSSAPDVIDTTDGFYYYWLYCLCNRYVYSSTPDNDLSSILDALSKNTDDITSALQSAGAQVVGSINDLSDKIDEQIAQDSQFYDDVNNKLDDKYNQDSQFQDELLNPSDDVQSQLDSNRDKVDHGDQALDSLADGLDLNKPQLDISDNPMANDISKSNISGIVSSMCNPEFVLPILGLIGTLIIISLLMFGV